MTESRPVGAKDGARKGNCEAQCQNSTDYPHCECISPLWLLAGNRGQDTTIPQEPEYEKSSARRGWRLELARKHRDRRTADGARASNVTRTVIRRVYAAKVPWGLRHCPIQSVRCEPAVAFPDVSTSDPLASRYWSKSMASETAHTVGSRATS